MQVEGSSSSSSVSTGASASVSSTDTTNTDSGSRVRESTKQRLKRWTTSKSLDIAWLNHMEKQTGVQKLYIVGALVFAFIITFNLLFGFTLFCHTLAFVMPAYMTYKTLETSDEKQHVVWLKYWIVYAFFIMVERVADITIFWFPYYRLVKFSILLAFIFPQTGTATAMYGIAVRPLLAKHEERIENFFDAIGSNALQVAGELREVAQEHLMKTFSYVAAALFVKNNNSNKDK